MRPKKRIFQRKRVCRFCTDSELELNYKNVTVLRNFVTERGKIIPRRIFGTCATHQRQVCEAIKRARHIALLPYSGNTPR